MTTLTYGTSLLADSISPAGVRLTTFEVTFPRFILAEFNTHRVLSRNSASSRAIPPELQIERVLADPFIPEFGTREKGMGSGEKNPSQDHAIQAWLRSRDAAVTAAQDLIDLNVDKARINRLLEPFMWHTVIATGTKWGNFFALRTDKDAQPEFRIVANMMLDQYEKHVPTALAVGEQHLPLLSHTDKLSVPPQLWAPISAGRCARVSFDTHHKSEPYENSLKRHTLLTNNGHWSPTEHQGIVMGSEEEAVPFHGNFHGDWAQYRKTFLYEDDFTWLKKSMETI